MFVFSNLKWIFDIEIWRKHAGKHISLEFLNFNIDFIYNNLHNIWRIHSSQNPDVADLQSAARRDRGAGRGAGGPQDHRDQRAERGGRAAREDRQPPRYLRGRGQ